jgi:hypothetical protein
MTARKILNLILNAVIDLPKNEQIIDVEITNPYQLGKAEWWKIYPECFGD